MKYIDSIECSEGHQYLIKFTNCNNLPIVLDVEVVNIDLTLVSNNTPINNAGTLNKIALMVFNFLDENDVILYFYCSKEDINRRNNKTSITPQEYRSLLFSTMFEKITKTTKDKTFINKPIILKDQEWGDHYLHFIAESKYSEKMDSLKEQMRLAFEK